VILGLMGALTWLGFQFVQTQSNAQQTAAVVMQIAQAATQTASSPTETPAPTGTLDLALAAQQIQVATRAQGATQTVVRGATLTIIALTPSNTPTTTSTGGTNLFSNVSIEQQSDSQIAISFNYRVDAKMQTPYFTFGAWIPSCSGSAAQLGFDPIKSTGSNIGKIDKGLKLRVNKQGSCISDSFTLMMFAGDVSGNNPFYTQTIPLAISLKCDNPNGCGLSFTGSSNPTITVNPTLPTGQSGCGNWYAGGNKGDVTIGIVDIVNATASLKGTNLSITINLGDVPETIILNSASLKDNSGDFFWTVYIDVDNNAQTGGTAMYYRANQRFPGWEYEMSVSHYKPPGTAEQTVRLASPISAWAQADILTPGSTDGSWHYTRKGISAAFDLTTKSISMSGIIDEIKPTSRLAIQTYAYNGQTTAQGEWLLLSPSGCK
jgi:hypothetical protein